jgi:hypothetical protein
LKNLHGILKDFWDGKISLPVTFWFYTVFVTFGFLTISSKILNAIYHHINFGSDDIYRPAYLDNLNICVFFIAFSWLLFSSIALWRCAQNYKKSKLIKIVSSCIAIFFSIWSIDVLIRIPLSMMNINYYDPINWLLSEFLNLKCNR